MLNASDRVGFPVKGNLCFRNHNIRSLLRAIWFTFEDGWLFLSFSTMAERRQLASAWTVTFGGGTSADDLRSRNR